MRGYRMMLCVPGWYFRNTGTMHRSEWTQTHWDLSVSHTRLRLVRPECIAADVTVGRIPASSEATGNLYASDLRGLEKG